MSEWLKKKLADLEHWPKGTDSLIVRLLPIALLLSCACGGTAELKAGDYWGFGRGFLLALLFSPVFCLPWFVLGEKGSDGKTITNWTILFAEIIVFIGWVTLLRR